MSDKYEKALEQCAEMLQSRHPLGHVKAIGLLEVPAALRDMLDDLDRLVKEALAREVSDE